MGKVKQKLEEDMELQSEFYINNHGDTWDNYIPEIIEESNKFNIPISDVIKAKKEELSQDL
tara:strand:- start:4895 stop:5077 length:183 start_codon:yes stop_codon:yes gene_type:complete